MAEVGRETELRGQGKERWKLHFSLSSQAIGGGGGVQGRVHPLASRLMGMRKEKERSLFWRLKKTQILSLGRLLHSLLPPPPNPPVIIY